ncbi:hypothetical protein FACS1894120_2700 [Clostridia bacterium]|nr:hypothetical protein FACS1894120_2700 [Clostridia bacterium]
MSYTIDMYRGHIKVQKNLLNFAAFVTMFPQIVAGPIVRYEDIQNEIDNRTITIDDIYDGIKIFVKGLGKKVLIANYIGTLYDNVNNISYSDMSAVSAWLGAIAFTLQIYFDFSGYSDMAIGLGRMLGFKFPQNFDHPYMSKSVSEFWRRWHMTLGNWFKSYVYFPLGGSRKGVKRTIFNLAVVWLLTGIWHGANWTYILWGCYFGLFIIFEKVYFSCILDRMNVSLRVIYNMVVVVFGWVLFSASSLTSAATYIKTMFGGGNGFAGRQDLYFLCNYGFVIVIGIIGSTTLPETLLQRFPKVSETVKTAGSLAVLVISTAYLVNAGYNPFLYFNF